MTFKEFLGSFFRKSSKHVSGGAVSDSGGYEELYTGAINGFAVFSVIDMIASLCAVAELKTYADGKPFKGLEWHKHDIKHIQTSVFMHKLSLESYSGGEVTPCTPIWV